MSAGMPERCSEWVSTVNGRKSGGKTALGGYSMPKHDTICDKLKGDGPYIRWSTRIYLKKVFQEASLQNHSKIFDRKEWNQLQIQHVLAFSVFKRKVEGWNSASCSAAGPFESCLDFLPLGNKSHNFAIEKKKKIDNAINVFLSLC